MNKKITSDQEDIPTPQVIAYLRVSTEAQELESQKLAVLKFANAEAIKIDEFIEITISSRKKIQQKHLTEKLSHLVQGDLLIVSELSRLGRSLGQIITLIDSFVKRKIRLIAIKENIRIDGEQDIQSKVMITLFGLFAELERDLISQRTKEGLALAKAKGKTLGRPKGSKGKSKLDSKEKEIRRYLDKKVSKASIAKILEVSSTTLRHFIKSRRIG
jgi:DNA invertase Pin-like site-specific DNA recombinase